MHEQQPDVLTDTGSAASLVAARASTTRSTDPRRLAPVPTGTAPGVVVPTSAPAMST
ncbi:MAG TPA: hypothetical protein VK735_41295 [Pseudonocardia sp.]|nr:hypothetical protein [Pseudonocardia sp.]